jgi:hypothetical protein
MEDDAHVFRAGKSPTKKASIISTVSDLLSDYSTTNAVARKHLRVVTLDLVQVNNFAYGYHCLRLRFTE